MKLYYLYNGQDYEGPFNKEELKSKKITNDTPIWSEDMVNWKKAGEINELKNSITTIPPLFKNTPPKFEKPKSSFLKYFMISTVIIILMTIIGYAITDNYHEKSAEVEANNDEIINREIRNQITNWVQIGTNNYNKDFWGGISNLEITVKNDTDFTLNSTTIAIEYIKQNGGTYKTEYLTFNDIPPHQNKTLSAPDSNRGLSVKIQTKKINSNELELCYNQEIAPAVGDPDPYKCK
jgi:hypothetical protein